MVKPQIYPSKQQTSWSLSMPSLAHVSLAFMFLLEQRIRIGFLLIPQWGNLTVTTALRETLKNKEINTQNSINSTNPPSFTQYLHTQHHPLR